MLNPAASLPETMNAIPFERYGTPDTLHLRQQPTPTATGQLVLVAVRASAVNAGDWFLLSGKPYAMRLATGIFRPKRKLFGQDMAGVVVAVGADVTRFRPGDAVYGDVQGSLAEYISVPERLLAHKPRNLDFEDAAAVPIAGNTALQGIRDAGAVKTGHRVLVNGASGGVGSFAVQIAKALGAEVTAVCSGRNRDRMFALGADRVLDYSVTNFTETSLRYHTILDLVGSQPIRRCLDILTPDGRYVSSVGSAGWAIKAGLMSLAPGSRIRMLNARPDGQRLEELTALIEAGQVAPMIDRRFELPQFREWIQHQGSGHTRGKSTIRLNWSAHRSAALNSAPPELPLPARAADIHTLERADGSSLRAVRGRLG